MLGSRGSSDEGWTWSRPAGEGSRLRALTVLGVAGAGIVALLAAAGLVAFLVLDDGSAGGPATTPTPATTVAGATPTVAATATATAPAERTPTATAPAQRTPTATPLPTRTLTSGGSTFTVAVWNGERWLSKPPLSLPFGEGEAVPFLLRIEDAKVESEYSFSLLHDCDGFAAITSYDREAGVTPALAGAGPGSIPSDSFVSIPGSGGGLSLWGGVFTDIDEERRGNGCEDEGRLEVSLRALRDDVFLLWGAALSDGAGALADPFRMTVEVAEAGEVLLWLSPSAVETQ